MNGGCYNHLCPNSTSYNTGYRAQDGVVSPLKREVQAPVKICVKSDSLHNVQLGAGLPSLSRQIIEIDNTAINASNIHIVRLMICLSVFWLPDRYMIRQIIFFNRAFRCHAPGDRMTG